MSFLLLLDSLHMGEQTRIKNELKNFLKITYEGKEMRAVADELKVIDLHMPKVPQQKGSTECGFMVLYFILRFILTAPTSFGTNDYPSFLTADWFLQEEYEKFMEDLQGKRIHIDAHSASTSKMVKRGPTMLRSVHGLQSNERIQVKVNQLGQPLGRGGGQLLKQFLGTVPWMGDELPIDCISWRLIPSSNKDVVWDFIEEIFRDIKLTQQSSTSSSIARMRVRILNFSGQVVASGILMSDDNDNVAIGKKLGGEYYEVSILIAHDPTASLFIKDTDRKNMNDAVGSHIIWFRE
ncbi:hypothetical protein Taro_002439, partial [Colocasia esculenta]|nr:hypothetical protein [Colocasia esculenta]